MHQLPEAAIRLIEKESKGIFMAQSDEEMFKSGAVYALTTPAVYQAAGLVDKAELEAARKEIEELKLIAKQDIIDFKKFKDQYIINDFINGIITSRMTHDQWYSLFKQQQNG